MLKLENLSLHHGNTHLLEDLSLHVQSGDFVAVIGENGCGKSTLLSCIAGLHKHYRGTLLFNGVHLHQWHIKQLAKFRAYVNQHSQLQFAFLTEEVLQLGRANQLESQQQSSAVICEIAEMLSISHLFGRDIRTLSGGERQRVFIAKALIQLVPQQNEKITNYKDKLLLLDEPTSALDFRFQKAMMDLVHSFCQQGLAVICVSHDINLVLPYAKEVMLLANGRCLASGSVGQVITSENLRQCFGITPRLITQTGAAPYITH
ncbi:MAG: ABC transporter ATP-binding protein [Paraglaciecola sp.]|uniref:ATP-binding cassette domain-containing protein n=1 Tax=Flavobacterium sp. W21_SRS_FM6 TaxID=3240268 RepID=UPI00275C8066|nr:ABC transporter ATP-binding protein [Paraglaciecola sp.]